jgi:hypothetical protein
LIVLIIRYCLDFSPALRLFRASGAPRFEVPRRQGYLAYRVIGYTTFSLDWSVGCWLCRNGHGLTIYSHLIPRSERHGEQLRFPTYATGDLIEVFGLLTPFVSMVVAIIEGLKGARVSPHTDWLHQSSFRNNSGVKRWFVNTERTLVHG